MSQSVRSSQCLTHDVLVIVKISRIVARMSSGSIMTKLDNSRSWIPQESRSIKCSQPIAVDRCSSWQATVRGELSPRIPLQIVAQSRHVARNSAVYETNGKRDENIFIIVLELIFGWIAPGRAKLSSIFFQREKFLYFSFFFHASVNPIIMKLAQHLTQQTLTRSQDATGCVFVIFTTRVHTCFVSARWSRITTAWRSTCSRNTHCLRDDADRNDRMTNQAYSLNF